MNPRAWFGFFVTSLNSRERTEADTIDATREHVGGIISQAASRGFGYASPDVPGADYFVFHHADYGPQGVRHERWLSRDPRVLPTAVLNHETDPELESIRSSLWRLCCLRSPLKVLLCYNDDPSTTGDLMRALDETVWEGRLMAGTDSALVVAVGDLIPGRDDFANDLRFRPFEWRDEEFRPLVWRRDVL